MMDDFTWWVTSAATLVAAVFIWGFVARYSRYRWNASPEGWAVMGAAVASSVLVTAALMRRINQRFPELIPETVLAWTVAASWTLVAIAYGYWLATLHKGQAEK